MWQSRLPQATRIPAYETNNPCTKSAKGPHTESAITNNTLAHTLYGDIRSENRKNLDTRVTWILLFHLHRNADETFEIRCELSLPLKMNAEGQVDEWLERIILGPIPFGGGSVKLPIDNPQTPDIDINVTRRRA